MGLKEKLEKAKKSDWLTQGFSDDDVKTVIELAQISARIERCRNELGMTQSQFADYMGVSQGMISKWESRDYNFTIKSLNSICEKLGLEFKMSIDYRKKTPEFKLVNLESDYDEKNINWINALNLEKSGEIA